MKSKLMNEMSRWPIEEVVRVANIFNIEDAEAWAADDVYGLVEAVAEARVENKRKQLMCGI